MEDIQIKDEWLQAIDCLPERTKGEILYAITTYIRSGNISSTMKPTVKAIFSLIKRQIDISRARAESGRKGGNSESKTQANPQANGKQTSSKGVSKCQANPQANTEQNPVKENKDDIPPIPPLEENKAKKENISKDIQKKKSFDERKQQFYNQIAAYTDQYPKEMLRQFYDYWSEANKSGTKMRFELERTWDMKLRLSRWSRNQKPTAKSAYNTGVILQADPNRYTNPQEQELAW